MLAAEQGVGGAAAGRWAGKPVHDAQEEINGDRTEGMTISSFLASVVVTRRSTGLLRRRGRAPSTGVSVAAFCADEVFDMQNVKT